MKFMLLILDNEKAQAARPAGEIDRIVNEHGRFAGELVAAGKLLGGNRLTPGAEAARVTREGQERVVVDGPFAESKEVLGGYYLIEVASKEEAVAWAKRCPIFEGDAIEVRQIWEMR
jgi:hypothetical protein